MIDGYSLFVIVACFIVAMIFACFADAIAQLRKMEASDDWLHEGGEKEGV